MTEVVGLASQVNLGSFLIAVDKLAREIDKSSADAKQREEDLLQIEDQQIRSKALLDGLKGLFGLTIKNIDILESGETFILVTVINCEISITLDDQSKVVGIEVLNQSPVSFHKEKILKEAQVLPAPNDIRHVIFFVGAVQRSAAALKQHLALYRKKCVIQQHNAYDFVLSFRNGVSIVMSAHECYPQAPCGIVIREIVDPEEESASARQWDQIVDEVNMQCFGELPQVFGYLESHYADMLEL